MIEMCCIWMDCKDLSNNSFRWAAGDAGVSWDRNGWTFVSCVQNACPCWFFLWMFKKPEARTKLDVTRITTSTDQINLDNLVIPCDTEGSIFCLIQTTATVVFNILLEGEEFNQRFCFFWAWDHSKNNMTSYVYNVAQCSWEKRLMKCNYCRCKVMQYWGVLHPPF